MKNFLAILCVTILFSSCDKERIKGEGAIISETRSIASFSDVQLNGSGEVNISYGATQQVTVTGYGNLLSIYETKLVGNILYLQFKPDVYNVRNNNIKVSITIPAVGLLRTNGSGNMYAKNFINGDVLTTSINGSGNIQVENCKYNKASYLISGSGDIKAGTTESTEATAQISGSGNIDLKVTNKLTANISGSGNINYWGNPGIVNTQVSGSGKINKR